jgi:DNA-binding LacI/PurR family transcriptional regulator
MRAINDLARENLVKRIPGKGTFVCFREKANDFPFHLIVPMVGNKYYSDMADNFNKFFWDTSAHGVVASTHYIPEYTKKTIESIIKCGTCGIAIVPSGVKAEAAELASMTDDIDCPILIGSRELEGFDGFQVIVDEEKAGRDAAEHLIRFGHSKIAYVGQTERYSSSVLRYKGFLAACHQAGLPPEDCPQIPKLDHIALHQIKKLFNSQNAPTAVVAPSEPHAIEAYDLLTSLGLKVPEEIAMISLDGGTLAPSIDIPLTTIDFPGGEIGRCLASGLWNIHNGLPPWKERDRILKLQAPLIIRASCGAHPEKYRHEYLRNMMSNIK